MDRTEAKKTMVTIQLGKYNPYSDRFAFYMDCRLPRPKVEEVYEDGPRRHAGILLCYPAT